MFRPLKRNLRIGYTPAGVQMSGPRIGDVTVASTFLLNAIGGVLSGPVVFTPSASNADGTFSPTTVTLTPAAPSGSFTYTPTVAGVRTISVTNNGGLTNSAPLSFVGGIQIGQCGVTPVYSNDPSAGGWQIDRLSGTCPWWTEVTRDVSGDTLSPYSMVARRDVFPEMADLFAGTPGTLLSTESSAWHLNPGYTGTAQIAASGYARPSTTAASLYYRSSTIDCNNNEVSAKVVLLTSTSSTQRAGVVARYDSASDSGYRAYYDVTRGAWVLDKVMSGTRTELGNYTAALSAGGDYVCLRAWFTTISLRVNDVELIRVTDSSRGGGYHGLYLFQDVVAPTDSTGLQLAAFHGSMRGVTCSGFGPGGGGLTYNIVSGNQPLLPIYDYTGVNLYGYAPYFAGMTQEGLPKNNSVNVTQNSATVTSRSAGEFTVSTCFVVVGGSYSFGYATDNNFYRVLSIASDGNSLTLDRPWPNATQAIGMVGPYDVNGGPVVPTLAAGPLRLPAGDHHIIVVQRDETTGLPSKLYESYQAMSDDGGQTWKAANLTIWDLKNGTQPADNQIGPTAASVCNWPFLVKADEVFGGAGIKHALRGDVITWWLAGYNTSGSGPGGGHIWPALGSSDYHWQQWDNMQAGYLIYGARLRLCDDFYTNFRSQFASDPAVQTILDALHKYGIVVTDATGAGQYLAIDGMGDPRYSSTTYGDIQKIPVGAFELCDAYFGPQLSFTGPASLTQGTPGTFTLQYLHDDINQDYSVTGWQVSASWDAGAHWTIIATGLNTTKANGGTATFNWTPTNQGALTLAITYDDSNYPWVTTDPLNYTVAAGPTPVIVDDSSTSGFAVAGSGWTRNYGGYGGYAGEYSFVHVTTGTGTYATWSFPGLSAQAYKVYWTWTASANRATAAPWKVYDSADRSGTVLASGTVNQQTAPTADFGSGGVNFQLMATVTPASGNLTFELNANGSDTADYIIADAVLLLPPA